MDNTSVKEQGKSSVNRGKQGKGTAILLKIPPELSQIPQNATKTWESNQASSTSQQH